jgi:hypothetical protein
VKGQSGTTVGIFTVLAVLVTVAVAGMTISENRQPPPLLEVVIDMPPPPPESVAEQTVVSAPQPEADGGAPGAPDQEIAEAREIEAESVVEGGSSPEARDREAQGPADPPAEDVPEIDTAAGSESLDDMPPPNFMPGSVDARTEDPEEVAASRAEAADGATDGTIASNETIDAEVGAADEQPSRVGADSLAATAVEPSTEERQPPVTSTFDAPASLFDAVIISRRSNLRSEPGPDSPVLAKLNPGERVFRLDDKPVEGYYRVSSGGIVGWIWWLNVSDGPGGNVEG